MNTSLFTNIFKSLFGSSITPTESQFVPITAQDGTPAGVSSMANLASVLGAGSALATGTDLNNVTKVGVYSFNATSQNIQNAPANNLYSCMMRVYSAQGSIVYQEVYAKPSCEKYVRSLNVSEGTWSKWFRIDNYGTSSLSELASALGVYLTRPAASIDLNTLNQKGIFATASVLGTSTWHDLHYPVYSSECFCLTIMRDSNVGFQIAITQGNTNTLYFRHRWSETTWGEWRAITTTNV